MDYEYDESKSHSNRSKYGIDFEEAKELWKDEAALIIRGHMKDNETRYGIIGQINEKLYAGFFTIRENKIRIISVRRARKEEERLYYDQD